MKRARLPQEADLSAEKRKSAPRILVVEDDEADFQILSRFIRRIHGHASQPLHATCPVSAQAALRDDAFDIVFVDQNLGSASGIDFVAGVRDDDPVAFDATAFILVTGNDNVSADNAALAAGFSDYLVKSDLGVVQLERTMRYALETRRRNQLLHEQKRALDAALKQARESEDGYRLLAESDPLTGIANRKFFMDRLNDHIVHGDCHTVAVLLMDLDRFKAINDTHGHHVGDELLCLMAQRLTKAIRPQDTAARLGGDEFAVVVPDADGQILDFASLGERISACLSAPSDILGHKIISQASIGIAVRNDEACDAETLLRRADAALYEAKKSWSRSFYVFDRTLQDETQWADLMERDLIRSIDDGEIHPYFQPKIDVRTGEVVGLEALARWHHPAVGMIPPSTFIPIAEKCGRILPLSHSVFAQACEAAVKLRDLGFGQIPMALNLASNQLLNGQLVDQVLAMLVEHGLAPEALEFEITESIMPAHLEAFAEEAARLRAMGTTITLDDFGTGLGSLENLRRLPICKLKIDRSFVQNMENSPLDNAIVTAIVSMARSIGLDLVAEGVETEEQLRRVRDLGCHEIQGYYFCGALDLDGLVAWLSARRVDPAIRSISHEPIGGALRACDP